MHPHVAHLFVRVGETKNGGGDETGGRSSKDKEGN